MNGFTTRFTPYLQYAVACEALIDAVAMLEAVLLLRTEWALQLAPSVAAAESFLRVCAARTLDRATAAGGMLFLAWNSSFATASLVAKFFNSTPS